MMYFPRWNHIWQILCLIILFELVAAATAADDADIIQVEIESGHIRGKRNVTLFEQKSYYSFRGIPYAQAPINDLRFKAPKKVSPWIDPFDAFNFGDECVQINFETTEIYGNEDCLFINVFVPAHAIEPDMNANLSVIVFIMGEVFQSGSSQNYGPDFLLEKDVIVVTFNYRMGAIGFMSLNLPDYAGNMGFKDQVLALKWVKQNIKQFGGGENITVLGHGAGAVSVSLHLISPASDGLFQNAIMLSGSSLNPSIPRVKDHLTILYNLAENLHYPIDNNRDLIEFLKQIDGNLLVQRTYQNFTNTGFGRRMANLIWSTVVEHPHAVDQFLGKTPFDILTGGDYSSSVNTIFGCTLEEMFGEFIDELINPELLKPFDKIFELQLPLRNAKLKFHSKEYKEMSTRVRDLYFKGNRVDNNTITGFQTLMTDVWFLYGIDLNARIQSNASTGNTYFSTFSVKSNWSYSSRRGKQFSFNFKFSHHFDQLPYLFRLNGKKLLSDEDYVNLEDSSTERKVIDLLSTFYANFAKFGNPLPDNEPVQFLQKVDKIENFNFLDITNKGVIVKSNPNRERIEFWDDIFDTYSQHWQTREFNINSLAVKIPLLMLALLLSSILGCKGIKICLRRNNKSISVRDV